MFILLTDEDGNEKFRLKVKNFNKKTSLREAVRFSLTKLLTFAATVSRDAKMSLVLDWRETELLSKIVRQLYGPGCRGKVWNDLLDLVLVEEVKRITWLDDKKFRIDAEDVCFKDSKNEDCGLPGISVYRTEKFRKD